MKDFWMLFASNNINTKTVVVVVIAAAAAFVVLFCFLNPVLML